MILNTNVWYSNFLEKALDAAAVKHLLILLLTIAILFVTSSVQPHPVMAADLANGAIIFDANCNGCHVKGGNIIRRGKNLKLKTLKKNGLDSVEVIAELISQGKNNMSAYQDRLTFTEIENVAAYVLNRAEANWK